MNAANLLEKSDQALARVEAGLRINKYALDEELQSQPAYFYEASQEYATAISYRDEAKAEFEGVRAKLDQQIRRQLADANEKSTEDGIKSRVVAHPEYQQAQTILAAWTDRTFRWDGLKDAIKQRGYALKDLAELYIAGYWADATGASGSGRQARSELAERAKDSLVEKHRRRIPGDAA